MKNERFLAVALVGASLVAGLSGAARAEEKGTLVCQSDPAIEMRLEGPLKLRIDNNVQQWLLRGPRANPALLAVFELRDRAPDSAKYYVPWVGEFIGKYLTNAIQFLRLSDDKELEKTVAILVERLIASQDADGYLGPFPKKDRLLVCWDLWGHYHAVTALLLWHERTGDAKALDAARRACDFACATFLDSDKRMKDVGSHEMNLSIITSFCQLYRLTGNERYWKMANEILKDWEDTGDYYRSGLSGKEYYQTPRPRWESIHCILALTELYRITGDENYRRAFKNLWQSARRLETHNNGSFSTNEQTIGNPYSCGAIETCCTVAWMAMTVDALRLTGDLNCADALELATFNAATSIQHPSGSWSTYDTPMNGRRQASFHSIVFQSRPGQPELNCCSVNAPRAFGMISEWGVMKGRDESGRETLFVQYYGPGTARLGINGVPVCLKQTTDYPRDGRILLEWESERQTPFSVRFRIPQWAEGARIRRPDSDDWESAPSGDYFVVDRTWKTGDRVELDFPMTLRYETGDRDFADRISIYRGPLLLAYDQRYNAFEEDAIPAILPEQLQSAAVEIPPRLERDECFGRYTPWILVTLGVGENGQTPLVLSDFGTAGELGTTYASWLPARKIKPPAPACVRPAEGERVPPGALGLKWRRIMNAEAYRFSAVISETPDFSRPVLTVSAEDGRRVLLTPEQTAILEPGKTYYWKVAAENEFGRSESVPPLPGRSFVIDPTLPPQTTERFTKLSGNGPDRVLLADPLAGRAAPDCGTLKSADGIAPAEGPNGEKEGAVRFDGKTGMAVYALDEFPSEYTLSLDFAADRFAPEQDYAHIFSGWCRGGDDPLRVFIDADGKLAAAVEGSGAGRTVGTKIETGRWYRLTVVKEEGTVTLFLDGKEIGSFFSVDEPLTDCKAVALGGNPLYRGRPEYFPGRIAGFRFCAEANRP